MSALPVSRLKGQSKPTKGPKKSFSTLSWPICSNYPQGNGRVERSFRTDEEEFYQSLPLRSRRVEELPADLGGLEAVLLRWNHVYETVRSHQALGYKTPAQFYQHWLITHPTRKEVLSDMS